MSKKDGKQIVHEVITSKIVELLEAGVVPWRKPWHGAEPCQSVHGHPYRGVNVFLTTMHCMANGFSDPRFITLNQIRKEGGRWWTPEAKLKEGEGKNHTPVILSKVEEKENKNGEKYTRWIFRYYRVYNVEQCEGLKLPELKKKEDREHTPIEECVRLIAGYQASGPKFAHGGPRAFYRPSEDLVQMPPAEKFISGESYYSILFHELIHSTGHEARLKRAGITDMVMFGDHKYSKEELVAEMGAAFLCGHAGIEAETIKNSAAYIQSWLKKLQADKTLVYTAARDAQLAVDMILERR